MMKISYRKTFQGAWELSTIKNGYLIIEQYMGYTKLQATQHFQELLSEA